MSEQPAGIHEPVPEREDTLKEYHPAMFANHPFSYIGLGILLVGGAIGSIAFLVMGNPGAALGCFVAFIFGGVSFAWWKLNVHFKVLTVTEKRTLYRQGILSKRTNEVQHDDVRNIQMDQSFFQRILGVGDLAISSSGQDDMEIQIKGIESAQEIVDLIRRYQ